LEQETQFNTLKESSQKLSDDLNKALENNKQMGQQIEDLSKKLETLTQNFNTVQKEKEVCFGRSSSFIDC
jgi:archaellum component FlaC